MTAPLWLKNTMQLIGLVKTRHLGYFLARVQANIVLCCLHRWYSVVSVIPKEGLAGPLQPCLLRVWQRQRSFKRHAFPWHSPSDLKLLILIQLGKYKIKSVTCSIQSASFNCHFGFMEGNGIIVEEREKKVLLVRHSSLSKPHGKTVKQLPNT